MLCVKLHSVTEIQAENSFPEISSTVCELSSKIRKKTFCHTMSIHWMKPLSIHKSYSFDQYSLLHRWWSQQNGQCTQYTLRLLTNWLAVFNISTNTVQVIRETVLQVKRPNQQYQTTEGKDATKKTKKMQTTQNTAIQQYNKETHIKSPSLH